MKKSPFRVVIESCVGFFFTILILLMANLLDGFIDNDNYERIVQFMNEYFYLVIIGSVIGFIANFVRAFHFPFNTPAPLIHAFNSLIFTYVFVRFLELLDLMFGIRLIEKIVDSELIVAFMYALFFVLTLVGGMIGVFAELFKHDKKYKKKKGQKGENEWCDEGDLEKWDKFKSAVKKGFKEFEKGMKEGKKENKD